MYVFEPTSASLDYLAEGAANIIYRPLGLPQSPSTEADLDFIPEGRTATPPPKEIQTLTVDPYLKGKLIRLRKDLSTTAPVTNSWNNFHNVISPLFLPSQLVSQDLFKIPPRIVQVLNAELRQQENAGSRPKKRHGTYLAEDEAYGTLITDMSSDEASISLEFKPKWLVQSPSAPQGSTRCRTCALRAMRQANQQDSYGSEAAKEGFCPLRLVSGDRSQVKTAVTQMLSSLEFSELRNLHLQDTIVNWIMGSSLIRRLKQLQIELDPVGILQADLGSQSFLTAMTLRDCTLFLKVSRFHYIRTLSNR